MTRVMKIFGIKRLNAAIGGHPDLPLESGARSRRRVVRPLLHVLRCCLPRSVWMNAWLTSIFPGMLG